MEQQKLEWFYNKIVGLQTDMYRFAYSVLKSSDLCEDAVHNAILKAHDNLHQLKNEEALYNYIYDMNFNFINNFLIILNNHNTRNNENGEESKHHSQNYREKRYFGFLCLFLFTLTLVAHILTFAFFRLFCLGFKYY